MNALSLLLIGIGIYLAGGLAAVISREKYCGLITLSFCLTGGIAVLSAAGTILYCGESAVITIAGNFPFNEIVLRLDPLAGYFIIIIAVGAFFSVWYGCGYTQSYCGKGYSLNTHFLFITILIAAMLSLTIVRNALAFLFVWEIMSLSSFFLVIFERDKAETIAVGIFYLVMMHISFIFIALGFLILREAAGSNNFEFYHAVLSGPKYQSTVNLAFLMFFIGFGMKAGMLFLHNWLPAAHTAAPSHISGLMSGVMIKMGIFGICLMVAVLGVPARWLCFLITFWAAGTALFGILYASVKDDYKRVLAYSSIENIGIIGMGMGIGLIGMSYGNAAMAMLGWSGALLHVLNHSLFKGVLFYGAGTVYLHTHTRNLNLLGGIYRFMPLNGILFLCGCLAVCGLPPFNGFISKFIIYYSVFTSRMLPDIWAVFAMVGLSVILALTGAVSVLCFTRLFGVLFLGAPRSQLPHSEKKHSWLLLTPVLCLATLCLLGGLFPKILLNCVEHPIAVVTGTALPQLPAALSAPITMITLVFQILIIVILVILGLRAWLLSRRNIKQDSTWACGYDFVSNKMQYTPASFSMSFIKLVEPAVKQEIGGDQVKGLFPDKNSYIFKIRDIFEFGIIQPLRKHSGALLGRLTWLQDGDMQHYLFYGILFLIIALIWVMEW
jgi:formate hydrogenlyase subunit 3/multisubunit Na+/H+ antiporter MnhD subunit